MKRIKLILAVLALLMIVGSASAYTFDETWNTQDFSQWTSHTSTGGTSFVTGWDGHALKQVGSSGSLVLWYNNTNQYNYWKIEYNSTSTIYFDYRQPVGDGVFLHGCYVTLTNVQISSSGQGNCMDITAINPITTVSGKTYRLEIFDHGSSIEYVATNITNGNNTVISDQTVADSQGFTSNEMLALQTVGVGTMYIDNVVATTVPAGTSSTIYFSNDTNGTNPITSSLMDGSHVWVNWQINNSDFANDGYSILVTNPNQTEVYYTDVYSATGIFGFVPGTSYPGAYGWDFTVPGMYTFELIDTHGVLATAYINLSNSSVPGGQNAMIYAAYDSGGYIPVSYFNLSQTAYLKTVIQNFDPQKYQYSIHINVWDGDSNIPGEPAGHWTEITSSTMITPEVLSSQFYRPTKYRLSIWAYYRDNSYPAYQISSDYFFTIRGSNPPPGTQGATGSLNFNKSAYNLGEQLNLSFTISNANFSQNLYKIELYKNGNWITAKSESQASGYWLPYHDKTAIGVYAAYLYELVPHPGMVDENGDPYYTKNTLAIATVNYGQASIAPTGNISTDKSTYNRSETVTFNYNASTNVRIEINNFAGFQSILTGLASGTNKQKTWYIPSNAPFGQYTASLEYNDGLGWITLDYATFTVTNIGYNNIEFTNDVNGVFLQGDTMAISAISTTNGYVVLKDSDNNILLNSSIVANTQTPYSYYIATTDPTGIWTVELHSDTGDIVASDTADIYTSGFGQPGTTLPGGTPAPGATVDYVGNPVSRKQAENNFLNEFYGSMAGLFSLAILATMFFFLSKMNIKW